MITNVSLVTVYCLDQDITKNFYIDVLGFEAILGDDDVHASILHGLGDNSGGHCTRASGGGGEGEPTAA